MNVLIYSPKFALRLQYILHFIFKELLGTEFSIINDAEEFKNYKSPKINYSKNRLCENEFYISPVDLLFEANITPQTIDCFETTGNKIFFKINNSDFSFDIFAASFYLLSRYEEYLPHTKDMYGRYAHENSIAFKEQFLQLPLINIWVLDFKLALQKKSPDFNSKPKIFGFIPTYDIDMAYAFKHKSLIRNLGGFFKSPSLKRILVLCGLAKDPFDIYDNLDLLHEKYQLKPIYFFLAPAKNSKYDKNILPNKNSMWQLVQQHVKKYTVGIHPSWQSGDDFLLLNIEKQQLEVMIEKDITISRQHYIRFNLPDGYRRLLIAEIKDDYSMGYGSINGFRASVASSFYWFDLIKNEETSLRIHPFCYMEANSLYEQKFTVKEAFEELVHYKTVCKKVAGTLITIWHNNVIGTDKLFDGWGKMYEEFLKIISDETGYKSDKK